MTPEVIGVTTGSLLWYGEPVTPWVELAKTARAGDKEITVLGDPLGWTKGKKLVIATSHRRDRGCKSPPRNHKNTGMGLPHR